MQQTGAHFLSSVLQPHVIKVMEYIVHSARENITSSHRSLQELASKAARSANATAAFPGGIPGHDVGPFPSQLFALNFVLGDNFKPNFVGISGDETHNGFFNEHENVKDVMESLMKTRQELVMEVAAEPALFVRMRKGDSYGNYRLVFSEMEEKRSEQPLLSPFCFHYYFLTLPLFLHSLLYAEKIFLRVQPVRVSA